MKKEDYIEKKVVLTGHGVICELALNEEWFDVMEVGHAGIAEVLEIKEGRGGIGGFFGIGGIEGCIILFKDGTVACAESDGEYIDLFWA